MHIRVYGVQPDELAMYQKAETELGFTFEFATAPLNESTVNEVESCDALILLTNCKVNTAVAEKLAANGVKYLATRSAGSDHIDYSAVKAAGLKCANVPAYAPEAISEHTILTALSIIRNAKRSANKIAAGDFTLANLRGRQLGQLTAGVLGSGRIGCTTMQMLKGFGTKIIGWDPYPNEHAAKLCTYVERDELFQAADIIFLHCPLTDDNYHIICQETLDMMKDGVYLVNTARGGLVDHKDVLTALESGKLSAFGFDVYEDEASFVRKVVDIDSLGDKTFQALLARDNVQYSAHVAFYTDGAIYSMIDVSLANLKEYETTGKCKNEIVEVI